MSDKANVKYLAIGVVVLVSVIIITLISIHTRDYDDFHHDHPMMMKSCGCSHDRMCDECRRRANPTWERPNNVDYDLVRYMRANAAPFPQSALKETNSEYARDSFDSQDQPFMTDRFGWRTKVYQGPTPGQQINGVTSVDPREYYVPASKKLDTPWEKAGVVVTTDPTDDGILNLFRRPISRGMDMWQYKVRDRHGFEVFLPDNSYVKDGDIVNVINGKESKGQWKVLLDEKYNWVYF